MPECPTCKNGARPTPCPTCSYYGRRNKGVSWRGIHKLQEEMGELQQILAKMCACGGTDHWEGDLLPRLYEELGDVRAAHEYFVDANIAVPFRSKVWQRCSDKLALFNTWVLTGISRG